MILWERHRHSSLKRKKESVSQCRHSVMSNSLRPHGLQHARLPWSLLKFMSVESVMPSNHLLLYHSFLLLPSIFPSISVFSSESALRIRWPKYWSFSFSISPSDEYSGLISFRLTGLISLCYTFVKTHKMCNTKSAP